MSGPKAFRIVTRAEVIAICRRDLARLEATIENWSLACRRNGTIEQQDIDKVMAHRDELRRLLDADRFVDLQKRVAAEISYLNSDIERRAERAAQAAARSRQDLRRAKAAAQAVIARLQASGIRVPNELQVELKSASRDQLDAAVSKAIQLLQPTGPSQGVTDRQRELAQRLGAGERRMTLDDWMSQHAQDGGDPVLLKVDKLLGELKGLGVDPSSFSARITALEAEAPTRQALVADSLLLDLTSTVKTARERQRIAAELRERQAELSQMSSPDAVALSAEIERTLAGETGTAAELIKRADALIEAEVRAIAAEARRAAVLEGLASLGYEVSEGMATAWVKDGRIVLRKAANPGYGVELSGSAQSDLLQVRAVGIGDPAEARDPLRDRDIETIWCGEFERLQALVAKRGGNLSIETARPAGQYPLKIISGPSRVAEADTERQLRSLPR
ncbi:MAG: hypothetical protein HY852_18795 [Bradyrhizobium sp.]|uniref:hypothetical protein n=1 Tax=Bradyrhizobium sp. TaxID=376 RepID=UPI0025C01138|nr:hypothetical protein [Bradyrhizobium sp.]MBI5263862.1 hypothetical protein [Bradyrhizobium sp.]